MRTYLLKSSIAYNLIENTNILLPNYRFEIEEYKPKTSNFIKRANLTLVNAGRRAGKTGVYHCTSTNGGITVTDSIELKVNCGKSL